MTLDEFIARWAGRGIDTDFAYGFQCMDLMHKYCQEVLGLSDLSILAAPAAKYVWYNFSTIKGRELFEKIPNTPTGVPLKGDIVLWDGQWGHVAVFRDGNVNSFNSFDQNYPVGSLCHMQYHNYTNVLGWLRFKTPAYTTQQFYIDTKIVIDSSDNDSNKVFRIKELSRKVGL